MMHQLVSFAALPAESNFAPCISLSVVKHPEGQSPCRPPQCFHDNLTEHGPDQILPTIPNDDRVAACYDEIFVPPFEPWSTSAATGTMVSGPGGLLEAAAGTDGDGVSRSALRKESADTLTGTRWVKPPEISSAAEVERCRLNLEPGGG